MSVEKGKEFCVTRTLVTSRGEQSGEQGGDVAEKAGRGWSRHGLRCPPKELGLRLLVIEGSKGEGHNKTGPSERSSGFSLETASWTRPEVLREGLGDSRSMEASG